MFSCRCKMISPNVTIIILNWNGWEDTIECLESLYQINYSNFDVIVLDNNSRDESWDKIKDYAQGKLEVKLELIFIPSNKSIESSWKVVKVSMKK